MAVQKMMQKDKKKAAADPEIQRLLRDPRIQQLFKDFKEIL